MIDTESLPLTHSWPIFAAAEQMAAARPTAPGAGAAPDALEQADIGRWSCDLADDSLIWSPAVFRLFGLPADEPICRRLTVSCYADRSRAAMQALRTHAIRHRRGFTLDAMIRRPDGETRWMRLSTLPVLSGRKVVRLHGTKQDVTAIYDGPGWRGF